MLLPSSSPCVSPEPWTVASRAEATSPNDHRCEVEVEGSQTAGHQRPTGVALGIDAGSEPTLRSSRGTEAPMPERASYAPGTPSWVDIGTDVASAKTFYGGLFGWDSMEAGPPEETGGYGFFLKDGKLVAGYGPQMNPGPPVWSTYVSVADTDDTIAKVTAAG